MEATKFEIKSYPDMWESLGMNVERFEKMRCALGDVYQTTFLTQETRPQRMDYFNWTVSEIHGGRIREILDAKKEGRPVVGTFCVYVPEELVIAAGGICIGLCGGSQGPVPDAEKTLPRNICPMVKSAYGFKVSKVCPYFQSVDFVYGETTCDAKKKTWELLNREVPTYVMEIPQAMGVEIYSCGTCLKHYGLEDELKVGHRGTTNHVVEGMKDFDKTVWIG